MTSCKKERSMEKNSARIEYETDQIKVENSDLTTQNRNLVYVLSFVTFRFIYLYHKSPEN
jgi:hypothetical protein